MAVSRAWGDTGTLCSLALRPALLKEVVRLYGASLVVTEAVADEVRRFARTPEARRTPETRLLCSGADVVARHLDAGLIKECPLPTSADTFDKIDEVLRQLREFDAAAAERTGRTLDRVSSAQKHAGEAHSIVSALRTMELHGTTLLLTNDGGAMAVAERNGIPWKHVGHLLAELACSDSAVEASLLFDSFMRVTRTFATVPQRRRPENESFFTCSMQGGHCSLCFNGAALRSLRTDFPASFQE